MSMHMSVRKIFLLIPVRLPAMVRIVFATGCMLVIALDGRSQTATSEKPPEKEKLPTEAETPPTEAPATSTEPSPAGPLTTPPPEPTDIIELERLEVKGDAVKNSIVTDRRDANISVDLLTTADFSKFISTDIGDLVIRIPGLSTSSQGSFAVVRGLAERYNPVMFDGIVVPSADPERQSPQLDIFPTRLVDAIVVSKSFEVRLPATSSGGAIDLRSKPLPEGRFAQIQIGARADEGVFKNDEFRTYRTDNPRTDSFAIGSKSRPTAPQVVPGSGSYGVAITKLLSDTKTNPLVGRPSSFPVGKKFGVILEDRFSLNDSGRAWGYSFNFGYDSSYGAEQGQSFSPGGIFQNNAYSRKLPVKVAQVTNYSHSEYAEYEEEIRIGGFLNLGYVFNERHALTASVFLSQIGIDTVTSKYNEFAVLEPEPDKTAFFAARKALAEGKRLDAYQIISSVDSTVLGGSEEIHYQERNLTDMKFGGSHKLGVDSATTIDWTFARISTSQNEPYFRKLVYVELLSPRLDSFFLSPSLIATGTVEGTSRVYWRDTTADSKNLRVDGQHIFDLGIFKNLRLQAGFSAESAERDSTEVGAFLSAGASSTPTARDLEELNRRLNGVSIFPAPFDGDSQATRRLDALYGSLLVPLVTNRKGIEKLEIMAGLRREKLDQSVTGSLAFANTPGIGYYTSSYGSDPVTLVNLTMDELMGINRDYTRDGVIDGLDVQYLGRLSGGIKESANYPAFSITYSPIRRFNVRLNTSKTVGRPSFREISPSITIDQVTDESQIGNFGLKASAVKNDDVRIEYFFPRSKDLMAVSAFSKKIDNPIEKIAPRTTFTLDPNVATWINNPANATLKGMEAEVVKNLGFLGAAMRGFTLGGNATYVDATVARVPVVEAAAIKANGPDRRLFDQPEWIANGYLTYENDPARLSVTVSYLAISEVLQMINQVTWDRFVAAYDRWDVSLNKRIGAHWKISLSGKNLADPVRKLIADPAATEEEIVYRHFNDGRSYSLTVTYDF
jgi:outer membrane receptor protein involved in Fe transport